MVKESNECAICGCKLHSGGEYATPTIEGRSHATNHHYIAERFLGRSANRKGEQRKGIFTESPWKLDNATGQFCYDCHEELLHNPVFLPQDIAGVSELVIRRGLSEIEKTESREKLGRRIQLLHEVLQRGIKELLKDKK
jgi:hypothetical protein